VTIRPLHYRYILTQKIVGSLLEYFTNNLSFLKCLLNVNFCVVTEDTWTVVLWEGVVCITERKNKSKPECHLLLIFVFNEIFIFERKVRA